jgi:hypothetical protein
LPAEDPDEFTRILAERMTLDQPTNAMEKSIVEEIFACNWRIRRLQTIEIALVDYEMLQKEDEIEKKLVHFDSGIHLAVSFKSLADTSRLLSLLSRYESRFYRIRDRAYQRLLDLRKTAPAAPQTQPEIEPASTAPPQPIVNTSVVGQASSSVIGCSQNLKSAKRTHRRSFLRRFRAHQMIYRGTRQGGAGGLACLLLAATSARAQAAFRPRVKYNTRIQGSGEFT